MPCYVLIPLRSSVSLEKLTTLVDQDIYEKYKYTNKGKLRVWYAICLNKKLQRYDVYINIDRKQKLLSRLIMDAQKGELVDHKNRDSLDNRRSNLRTVTSKQSQWNVRKIKGTRFPYKGVRLTTTSSGKIRYIVEINLSNKLTRPKSLGAFNTPEDAARAYDRWVIQNRDEFAYTNFPRSDYL